MSNVKKSKLYSEQAENFLHIMLIVFLEAQFHSFLNSALYGHLQCKFIKPVTYAQIELCLPFTSCGYKM